MNFSNTEKYRKFAFCAFTFRIISREIKTFFRKTFQMISNDFIGIVKVKNGSRPGIFVKVSCVAVKFLEVIQVRELLKLRKDLFRMNDDGEVKFESNDVGSSLGKVKSRYYSKLGLDF